jgi:uncharacterized protein (DUF2384 family)
MRSVRSKLASRMSRPLVARPRRHDIEGKTLKIRSQAAYGFGSARPALTRLVDTLGNNATGQILGVDRAQVSRWRNRREPISPEMWRRIIDADYVLTRLLQVFYPDDAAQWLVTPEPLLNGARAVDVLALRGPALVIRALDGIVQGVSA